MTKPLYRRPAFWAPVLIILSLAGGIGIGMLTGRHSSGVNPKLEKIQNMLGIIEENYVDELDLDSMLEKAIPDIIAQLDPHSEYITANDLKAFNEDISGSFSGVGISFNMLTDTITVLEIISGGPAEKVGMLAGDRIVTINDTVVTDQDWNDRQVMSRLRGPKNTTVKLGVRRDTSPELLYFTVTRDDIPVNSVDAAYMIDSNTGYIKINKFAQTTFSETLTALTQLRNEGARQYIIDLRGNGGGLVSEVELIANELLSQGETIVSMKGRIPQINQQAVATGSGSYRNEPLVILIDEFSASASEILAGAIQDNDRGLVIGRRSFGKGLVQDVVNLPDGSALKLTVARYYTPSGRCIQKTYTMGNKDAYDSDLIDRFNRGEALNADSIHLDRSMVYTTAGGREVYGGGGIMPDIFVANDTTGISDYYIKVFNAGLLQKYAFNYTDANRTALSDIEDLDALMAALPSDDQLLSSFVEYARTEGKVVPRWYYINLSRDLIVSQLKALIARDVLGISASYQVSNLTDPTVQEALKQLRQGYVMKPETLTS
ncbi:MAG: S41 family peptidase, partial [Paramuribaculum sp.]|nr:S41 family peptidase [Paramuribaculum sp.]